MIAYMSDIWTCKQKYTAGTIVTVDLEGASRVTDRDVSWQPPWEKSYTGKHGSRQNPGPFLSFLFPNAAACMGNAMLSPAKDVSCQLTTSTCLLR